MVKKRILYKTLIIIFIAGFSGLIPVILIAMQSSEMQGSDRDIEPVMHAMTLSQLQEKFYKAEIKTEISVGFENELLEDALRQIAKDTGLRLTYRGDKLVEKRVSLHKERITVSNALAFILQDTGLDYRFSRDGYLLITEAETALEEELFQETVTGIVVDAQTGEVLPGVNVIVMGSEEETGSIIGTQTDMDGNYSVNVPEELNTLAFTYIGYQRLEVDIDGRSEIDIQLQQDIQMLGDVVVVGYGVQRRADVTGSISSVTAEDIERASVTSVDQALQGKVAGVFVNRASNQPGGGSTIRIRGGSSINAANEPLYVIDGVPVFNSISDSRAGGVNVGVGINPLATIGAENVQSIEVLKDASATAIYGSRGSNGVILITTKQGNIGQNNVDIDASYSVSRVAKTLDLLNARQFAELANEAHINSGNPPQFTEEEINAMGVGTDWQDEIFQTAPTQEYNLTFSGGDQSTQYLISGNYFDQQGIILGSDFERLRLRTNIRRDMSSRFRVGLNSTISRSFSHIVNTENTSGVLYQAITLPPVLPVREEDGAWMMTNPFGLIVNNPIAQAQDLHNTNKIIRYLGSAFLEYDIMDNLSLRTSLGIDILNNEQEYYAPSIIQEGLGSQGVARLGEVNRTSWQSETLLNYRDLFRGIHDISLMAGFSIEGNERNTLMAGSSGFVTDILLANDLSAGANIVTPQSSWAGWNLASWLGRANYIYNDRYLFTISGRVDGSSRFGAENRYGFFPSGAFAWTITNEDFFNVHSIEELKVRLSYGQTGNQEIGNFSHLNVLNSTDVILGDGRVIGFFPNAVANPDLKWEKTEQYNVGIDVQLLNGRIVLTTDYYYKLTNDLIFNVPIPRSSGFGSAIQNLGQVENKGLDFSLNHSHQVTDFFWNTSFNINFNRNKVVDLGERGTFFSGPIDGNLKMEDTFIVTEGEPLGAFYGYKFGGIFQNEQEIVNSAQPNAMPGDVKYLDLDGDGAITGSDREIIGYAQPDFTGGISVNLGYRNVELSTNGVFVYGNKIFNMNRVELDYPSGAGNASTIVLNRWTADNPSNTIQRANRIREAPFSDRFLEDGSYFRIQSVMLAYNFQSTILERFGMRNLRAYISADNLALFTRYSGYDPDVNSYGQDQLAFGADRGAYPASRTFTLGFNLGF